MNLTQAQLMGVVRALIAYLAGRFASAQVFNDPVVVEGITGLVFVAISAWSVKSNKPTQ